MNQYQFEAQFDELSLLIAQGAKGPAEPRICRQQRLRLWIRRPRPAGQALGLLQIEYSNKFIESSVCRKYNMTTWSLRLMVSNDSAASRQLCPQGGDTISTITDTMVNTFT